MSINSQTKVALVTAFCLIVQGYLFTSILKIEPNMVVTLTPLIIYVIYMAAKSQGSLKYESWILWSAVIIIITAANLVSYAMGFGSGWPFT